MVDFKFIADNLHNTPHWKRDLDKLLKKQRARRSNAIAFYTFNSTEIWLSYKFRIKPEGKGEFYYINHRKNNREPVKRIRCGQFGEVSILREPSKFVALAPVFYPIFFKWIFRPKKLRHQR